MISRTVFVFSIIYNAIPHSTDIDSKTIIEVSDDLMMVS